MSGVKWTTTERDFCGHPDVGGLLSTCFHFVSFNSVFTSTATTQQRKREAPVILLMRRGSWVASMLSCFAYYGWQHIRASTRVEINKYFKREPKLREKRANRTPTLMWKTSKVVTPIVEVDILLTLNRCCKHFNWELVAVLDTKIEKASYKSTFLRNEYFKCCASCWLLPLLSVDM